MGFPTTFAGWATYIRDWLGTDEYSDAQVGQFLDLAQLRLNREMASYGMEALATITVADANPIGILAVIPDFNKIRLVSVRGLGPYNTAEINEMEGYRQSGQVPAGNTKGFYTIDADKLYLFPMPVVGAFVDIFYYKIIPPLSASPVVNTNVFSTMYPDALLYATCLEASSYTIDDDRGPIWENKYNIALAVANEVSKDIKMGSTPLVREIARVS